MLNLITLQSATAEAGGAGVMNIIMIVLLILVFWLFMIRPQQKKQRDIRKFRESLDKGSKVVTAGGIHGVIRSINDTTMDLEVANGVKITVDKTSIYPSADAQAQAQPQK